MNKRYWFLISVTKEGYPFCWCIFLVLLLCLVSKIYIFLLYIQWRMKSYTSTFLKTIYVWIICTFIWVENCRTFVTSGQYGSLDVRNCSILTEVLVVWEVREIYFSKNMLLYLEKKMLELFDTNCIMWQSHFCSHTQYVIWKCVFFFSLDIVQSVWVLLPWREATALCRKPRVITASLTDSMWSY